MTRATALPRFNIYRNGRRSEKSGFSKITDWQGVRCVQMDGLSLGRIIDHSDSESISKVFAAVSCHNVRLPVSASYNLHLAVMLRNQRARRHEIEL